MKMHFACSQVPAQKLKTQKARQGGRSLGPSLCCWVHQLLPGARTGTAGTWDARVPSSHVGQQCRLRCHQNQPGRPIPGLCRAWGPSHHEEGLQNSSLTEQGQGPHAAPPGHPTGSTSASAPARASPRQTGGTGTLSPQPSPTDSHGTRGRTHQCSTMVGRSPRETLGEVHGQTPTNPLLRLSVQRPRPSPVPRLGNGGQPTWEGPTAGRKRLFLSSRARVINSWHF